MQHLGHEFLRRHQAELVVERQLIDQGHPQRRERLGPLGRERQTERRIVRAEMLARMRLEGQRGERHLGARGMRRPDHLRMPPVHAVEVAQRHGGAPRIGGQFPPVMEDPDHDRDGT